MAFCYSNERPVRLGYYDGAIGVNPTLLSVWVMNSNDLQRVEAMIRARSFGSIPFTHFFLRSWTYYVDFSVDSDVCKDDSSYRDVLLFASAGTPYANTSVPTAGITRVALGLN